MTILRQYMMIAAAGQGEALGAALGVLAAKVLPLAGCEDVRLYADPDQSGTFLFVEYWSSRENHEAAGRKLGREVFAGVMALLSQPPEGRYLEAVPLA